MSYEKPAAEIVLDLLYLTADRALAQMQLTGCGRETAATHDYEERLQDIEGRMAIDSHVCMSRMAAMQYYRLSAEMTRIRCAYCVIPRAAK